MFLNKGNYDKIADELIAYIGKEFLGYVLFIGFPFSNKNANEYFNKKKYNVLIL